MSNDFIDEGAHRKIASAASNDAYLKVMGLIDRVTVLAVDQYTTRPIIRTAYGPAEIAVKRAVTDVTREVYGYVQKYGVPNE